MAKSLHKLFTDSRNNQKDIFKSKEFLYIFAETIKQLDMKKFDFETIEKKAIKAADLGSVIGLGICVVTLLALVVYNIARL